MGASGHVCTQTWSLLPPSVSPTAGAERRVGDQESGNVGLGSQFILPQQQAGARALGS